MGTQGSEGKRGSGHASEDGSGDGMVVAEDRDRHTSGYQARVPSIPEGTGAHEVAPDGSERAGVYGDGQGATTAVAVGDRQVRGAMVCLRWLDAAECCTLVGVPMGRRWQRAYERDDMGR